MDSDGIITLLCIIGLYIIGVIVGVRAFDKYDVNRDGIVSVSDYEELKKYIEEEIMNDELEKGNSDK